MDSLFQLPGFAKNDTLQIVAYSILAEEQAEVNPDSAIISADKVIALSKKLDLKLEEISAYGQKGYALTNLGNYPRSLQTLLLGIELASDPASDNNILSNHYPSIDELCRRNVSADFQRLDRLSRIHQYLGILYDQASNYEKEKWHYLKGKEIATQTNNIPLLSIINGTLGRVYMYLKNYDSALIIQQESYNQAIQSDYKKYRGSILLNLARIYNAKGDKKQAVEYFKKSIEASKEQSYLRGVVAGNLYLSDIYMQMNKYDSALLFIKSANVVADQLNIPGLLVRTYSAYTKLYRNFEKNDSILKYQTLIIKINDSVFNSKQIQQFQNIDFDQQQREIEKEASEKDYKNKLTQFGLLIGLGFFLLLATILWRNNRNRQRAYLLLHRQKEETDFQKSKVEQTLSELKSTQDQLIQAEKMASLGELTAGIAHEIQNPLNFVNNFSEVNKELITDLLTEIDKKNFDEVNKIAKDIESNEEKINHHGKRAGAIVKSMLQHSRQSTGKKELTDINALTDEYVRLAYHGMRAKDKSFNVAIDTKLDPSVGTISIIPQDIGRVLLNLVTNSFHAVGEKKSKNLPGFEPFVLVTTKKIDNAVEIRVKDNGTGIPANELNKIFQPFFTTKPTGQGTGLGLSLSYDIITNGHGGELKVETKDGDYTEFIIILPI